MPWLEIALTASRADLPRIERALSTLGAVAVTLSDAQQDPIFEPAPEEVRLWSSVQIRGLFDLELQPDALHRRLVERLGPLQDFQHRVLADRAWARAWMDDFKPTRFGTGLWVCPHGSEPPEAYTAVVYLDPGLAFGTGTHATTALCLEYLDGAEIRAASVLDYGCGSGILAIAALALGAGAAVAVDHDPQALRATLDNAERNGCNDRLRVLAPPWHPNGSMDLVVANILAGPLVELAPTLQAAVRPGGILLLSGLLVDQVPAVSTAYRSGARDIRTLVKDGWALLAVQCR